MRKQLATRSRGLPAVGRQRISSVLAVRVCHDLVILEAVNAF